MAKHDARPLRTVLFCAGHDEREITEGYASGADSIVIDLEEPRSPFPEPEREKARALVKSFLAGLPAEGGPLVFARVQNPTSGQTLKDLRAVLSPRLAGVLIPKIEGPEGVHGADAILTCMESEMGLERGRTMIYPILETAQALRMAYEIAMASPRVSYMGGAISRFGDIHQAIGYRWTQEGRETLFLRSKVLIDAKAAGIRYPISGMWGGALNDEAGLRTWCKELRDLGYYGIMIGDKKLIPVVHEVFSPSEAELTYWKRLDRLAREAEQRADSGPILDGDYNQGEAHIVHQAHIGSARKNLAWARELGLA
jgi:citrate lyase subunit beta/citryl-CoA lyase